MNNDYFYLKVFGERNTGTNYLIQLILRNYHCDSLNGNTQGAYYRRLSETLEKNVGSRLILERYQDLEHQRKLQSDFGWKHACPPNDIMATSGHAKHTLFVFITKNPYFWVKSLYERDYHSLVKKSKSLSEFIRTRWIPVLRDNIKPLVLDSPAQMWALKVRSYIDLIDAKQFEAILIRYEDLLADYKVCLRSLDKYFDKKGATYVNIESSTKNDSTTYDDYRLKYDPHNIHKFLSETDIQVINQYIPTELFDYLGYQRL